MTGGDHPMAGERDCGADAAAYVLGALDAAEAEAFTRHLAGCAVCQDEVAAFKQVRDALPMAAVQLSPPRALRKRVMKAVRAEPRGAEGRGSRPASGRAPRRGPAWLPGAPAPAGLATAAVAVVAIGVIAVLGLSSGSAKQRVIDANVTIRGASAQLRLNGGNGELTVQHFPLPAAGSIYEVWLGRASGPPAPTGALFSVTAAGTAQVGIPGSLTGVQQVMVTEEPAGGSLAPTHAPVIAARL